MMFVARCAGTWYVAILGSERLTQVPRSGTNGIFKDPSLIGLYHVADREILMVGSALLHEGGKHAMGFKIKNT